jgi:tocopherol O-methyltransferase
MARPPSLPSPPGAPGPQGTPGAAGGPGPADVARHYDVLDPYYRSLWGEHVHHGLWQRGARSLAEATAALLHHVVDRGGIPDGADVCDIGSGYGATARFLAREIGARVTAVTVSPVQHAAALASPPVTPAPDYRLGDFLESALPSASFDAAIAVESLSHMPDLGATLGEVRRILRPGAPFVACVWLAGDDISGWRERHLLGPIRREGRLTRLSTAGEVESALRDAGFRLDGFDDLSRDVRRTWSVVVGRVVARLARDPEARRVVAAGGEAVFARTVARIWLAYRVGAMRYGVFTARAPGGG